MLFRRHILEGIARGEVTLAFRRWKRPTVKAGGSVRTTLGVVQIGAVDQVPLGAVSERDANASGMSSLSDLREMLGPDDGTPVYRIELRGIEPDGRVSLGEAADMSDAEWREIERRFERWDNTAPGYFPRILAVIGVRQTFRRPSSRLSSASRR